MNIDKDLTLCICIGMIPYLCTRDSRLFRAIYHFQLAIKNNSMEKSQLKYIYLECRFYAHSIHVKTFKI